jgi:hypothetical protein
MTSYRREILGQIRDGKRFWSYAEIGNMDDFRKKVVEPLRELNREGVVPVLSEITSPVDAREMVTGVQIIGEIESLDADHDE